MNTLHVNWKPEFGTVYTWFAIDKLGKVAVMVNNCFGDLPRKLLLINNTESLLDQLTDYMWEESQNFCDYPKNKQGKTILDFYSGPRFKHMANKSEVMQWVSERSSNNQKLREYNIPSIKGYFVYHGVEGSYEGEDYPVGYEGKSKMGDYFRFLVPTVYASIEDFPDELRHGIAVSETLDFTVDRLLDNSKINEYFPKMYQE